MSIESDLQARSTICELCASPPPLLAYEVLPAQNNGAQGYVHICNTCQNQLEGQEEINPNHWRALSDSMWSEVQAVQVIAWRMLNRLRREGWPQDLLDMLYLDEETQQWAKTGFSVDEPDQQAPHKDSNGAILEAGDTVVLIKDLNVKGANFTAKRGTAVRRISLVHDNPNHIEGKVNGQHIVILTQFVKKSK